MSRAIFPCCPGKEQQNIRIEFIPIKVFAIMRILGEQNKYSLDNMNPRATIPENLLREGLFNVTPENKELLEHSVKAICTVCGNSHPITDIKLVPSCMECGKTQEIKFCKSRGEWLCKRCAKEYYPACTCGPSADCYTASKK